jgi:V/A-type H+-transporting ATPase subunit I
LYKKKNIALAAILSFAGVFSTIFGFAYGSVFGYEHAIPTMWLKPMEETTTILIVSVVFGIGLIVVAMLINIINKIRQGKIGEALFDTNGVSGLIFYIAALASVALIVIGKVEIAGWILAIFIGLPLILTAFKEPIINFMEHKKHLIKGKKGEYFMETFFEMFEVLLSYVTNTISFVRIGAFALSHAGMMSVVHMLSETTSGQNIIVLILGNILVMGLEGLIVGIQVLRLEYYEMFSRFFTAGGKEFKPYKSIKE